MNTLRTLLGDSQVDTSIVCLSSALGAVGEGYRLEIFDDGTLTEISRERLVRELPRVTIVERRDREEEVSEKLSRYPACRQQRDANVLFMKLFDVMLTGESDYLEYVDSDVYFLSRVTNGMRRSDDRPLFMHDVTSSYSVRPGDLVGPAKVALPAKLNTGIIGFPAVAFDLEFLECVMRTERAVRRFSRISCWAEQTCWALLGGRSGATLIEPAQASIVDSDNAPEDTPATVALHFVSSYRSQLRPFVEGAVSRRDGEPVEWRAVESRPLTPAEVFAAGVRRKVSRLPLWR